MKRFLGLSAIFNIIFSSLFLYNLQGDSKVMAQFEYINDMNLQEDVAQPTEPTQSSCKRRKRSTNESSIQTTPDDCMVFRYTCPDREIRISWLQAAPFLYDANSNGNKSEESTPNITGIFHEVLTRTIGYCCKHFAPKTPPIRFLKRAPNLMSLRRQLLEHSVDMIIPVHNDEERYGGSFPFVKILDSPGVVLIVPGSSMVTKWNLVFKAVLGTWPVILMAFLLSSVAGVVIWVLVSRCRSNCFCPRLYPMNFVNYIEVLWFNFILSMNFIFLCLKQNLNQGEN